MTTNETVRTASLLIAFTCIVAGSLLLLQRAGTNGVRLWPMVLVAVGLAGIGSPASGERDEALWLVATGCWLLLTTLVPAFIRETGPLMMVGAGLVTFRWALAPNTAPSTRETSHVN